MTSEMAPVSPMSPTTSAAQMGSFKESLDGAWSKVTTWTTNAKTWVVDTFNNRLLPIINKIIDACKRGFENLKKVCKEHPEAVKAAAIGVAVGALSVLAFNYFCGSKKGADEEKQKDSKLDQTKKA